MRPAGRLVLPSFAYAIVAAWSLAPLVPVLSTHLPHHPGEPDLQVGVWLPWHVAGRLAEGANPLFAPELLWPDGLDLTPYVWNLGCALIQAPLFLLFRPILAFNLSILVFAALNGLAGHALGRRLGGEAGAWTAGLLATLAFEPLYELCSGRPEQGFLAPLLLAALFLDRLLETPGAWRNRLGLGLSMGLAGACYWFGPVLFAVCAALPVLVLLRSDRLRGLALAVVVSVIASSWAWIPVLLVLPGHVLGRSIAWSAEEVLAGRLDQSLVASGLARILVPRGLSRIDTVFPLALSIAVLAGLVLPVRRRAGVLLGIVGVALILALGPRLRFQAGDAGVWGPFSLLDALPGFARFWWPRRFLGVATVGAVGVAALVVASRPRSYAWSGVLVGLLALELGEVAPRSRTAAGGGAVHAVVVPASLTGASGPVLQIPLLVLPNDRVIDQVFHRRPLFGALAQNHPALAPAALLERASRMPFCVLVASGCAPIQPAVLRRELSVAGFATAVLHLDTPTKIPELLPWARERLGDPDWTEGACVGWELGP